MDRIPEKDSQVQLADGRTLSYAVLGDQEAARTVVVLDGPGSRGLARAAADAASDRGVRLIAPDRPGFLRSTPHPGRTFASVAQDVLAIAPPRFAVLAQSGGTPYALAVAAAAPDRVTKLAFVGGMTPLGENDALNGVGGPMRGLFVLARRAPWALRPLLALGARGNTQKTADKLAQAAPPADQAVLGQPRYRDVHDRTSAEALQSPAAFASEVALLAKPWSIEPVAMPVALWVGERDATHPPIMARRLAERLGGAPVTVVPGAATFGLVPVFGDVLGFLA
jgi:pimeloyl-ACP methyl ester carboxylesterase